MGSGVGLNKQERLALEGQTPFIKWMYEHGIREFMDYATGIVGIQRRISYQSLKEEMYVAPQSGVSKTETGKPTTNKIIRAIERLKRLGLLRETTEAPLVFECLLANRDKTDQNQAGTRQVRQKGTQADRNKPRRNTVTATVRESKINWVGTEAGTPENAQVGTPPLSEQIDINTNVFISSSTDNQLRIIFENDFWQPYPKEFRAKKKEAFELYRKKNLYEIKDTIKADICVRKEKHQPWKDGYVPHPTTYLRGERWTDEIREVSVNGGGNNRGGNRKGESIESILDSCFPSNAREEGNEIAREFSSMD